MNRLWVGLGSVLALIAIGAYFWVRPAPQQLPTPTPAVTPAVSPPAACRGNGWSRRWSFWPIAGVLADSRACESHCGLISPIRSST